MTQQNEFKLWLPREFIEANQPAWAKYWKDIAPKLDTYLQANENLLVKRYLINSFAIFSFIIEDFDNKSTKFPELRPKLSIFLVETHDLMRGIIANHIHMTLAPLALILRTTFEIHVNFRFIVKSDQPEKWADLYDRFQVVEQLFGAHSSSSIPSPTEEDFKRVATNNPEWFKSGSTKPINPNHWTACKGMNLREMSKKSHVNLEEEYKMVYSTNSKFTHASPLLRNMYTKNGSLRSVPDRKQSDHMALLAMASCMKILKEACEFFAVEFPEHDYSLVLNDYFEAEGGKRLDPETFRPRKRLNL